jgi:hypothetical protein
MKRNFKINCRNIMKRTVLAITLTGMFHILAAAQDQPKVQEKSEATIELSYYKKADLTKTIVAIVKVRKDDKFVFAKNMRVNFYVMHDKEMQLLKSINTNNKGQAVIVLQKDLPLDKDLSFTIMAKIENDSQCEDAEEQIHYIDASLSLKLNPNDTARLVTAVVTEIGKDGKEIPVKDVEIKFYIQRLFGIMQAAEENTIGTDENGEASFVCPKNIPGDTAGVINIVAKIEDNDKFGNIETKAASLWGSVLAIENNPFPRALWEPKAPLSLIITLSIIFGGVWFIYFFIFFQLRKIKKEDEPITKNPKS